jgi:branched-subunit amino acid ABC-type transport system permease component
VSDFLNYVILGIPFGCVFALVAVGLVLTYKTSGVFNLAFGAQAFVSAAVFYNTVTNHDWPLLPAFILSVFIVAPLVGLILERALFRHLRTAPAIAKLVTSLGLLIAIPEIVKLLPDFDFLQSSVFNPPTIWPNPFAYYHFGDYVLDGNQVATIISTVAAVLFLTALFRYTTVGLQMRAVVESPRMTELAGINADRVSAFSWMLSSTFAGLAGVLLAPLFAQLAAPNFTILLIAAIAAAAFGRLTSIPLAFLGGILLGVAQGVLGGYLPSDSILANGLRPSLPFVVLFLLLLFWPGLRQRSEIVDPLSGVDPPPPGLAAARRMRALTYATWVLGAVVIAIGLYVALFVVSSFWLLIITKAVIFSLIFLSITVITGMAGQISLCQASFAAVGAAGTAQLVSHFGLPVLLTMVIGAVMAGAVGALLAVPALRLGGIFLALATLAFAFMFESIFVPLDWVSGGVLPTKVPRPTVFEGDRAFLFLALGLLVVVAIVVILVRKGTTGRYLDALRGSETAATAIGINPSRARVLAFALSAGIAGLGGGLLTIQENQANFTANYSPLLGLLWLVIVVTLGARTVEGAVQAGLAFAFVPEILKALGLSPAYQFILFGLGAITYARHPEGIVEYNKRRSLDAVQRFLTRGRTPPPGEHGEAVVAPRRAPATVATARAGNTGVDS